MDLGLKDACVLVTAASQGLGAATARRFSMEGAKVVINSRNPEKLQKMAASISAETGNPVFAIAGDVTDPQSVQKLIADSVAALGGLDVLVTNAGGPPGGTFDKFEMNDWEKATQLTFLSAVRLIHEAMPHLQKSSRAAILAITSISVKEPVDNLTLSNAIRPAVVGLTKTLALEYGSQDIRVNSILPGITDTPRIDDLVQYRAGANNTTPEEERAKFASNIPLGRTGKPEEFANAAVFLCSPAAGFITGVALPVDGGTIRATL
jgi:3-oxoacyl-[acyl-carrier protein] reductase